LFYWAGVDMFVALLGRGWYVCSVTLVTNIETCSWYKKRTFGSFM